MTAAQTPVGESTLRAATTELLEGRGGGTPAVRETGEAAPLFETLPFELRPADELPAAFGRYRVERLLGRGAMGSVYMAFDTHLERRVALKAPRRWADVSGEVRERFFREARALATLNHPHICPVYDVGVIAGRHYISMGFIEGRSLAQHLEGGATLPPRQAAALVRKLALALAEAHDRGLIHRDLKPRNIMIDRRREPIVTDFGLAVRLDDQQARMTQSGTIVGTPAYMAPEQWEGRLEDVGPASDIYSLGVMLYEMIVGRLPRAGRPMTVFRQILEQPVPRLSAAVTGIDPELDELCAQMLDKAPAARPASMRKVAQILTDVIRRSEGQASPGGPAVRAASAPAAPPASPPPPGYAPARRTATTGEAPVAPPPVAWAPPPKPAQIDERRGGRAGSPSWLPAALGSLLAAAVLAGGATARVDWQTPVASLLGTLRATASQWAASVAPIADEDVTGGEESNSAGEATSAISEGAFVSTAIQDESDPRSPGEASQNLPTPTAVPGTSALPSASSVGQGSGQGAFPRRFPAAAFGGECPPSSSNGASGCSAVPANG